MNDKRIIRTLIMDILKEKKETTIHEIAEKYNQSFSIPASRRTIQRVLSDLIKEKEIKAVGNARARKYISKVHATKRIEGGPLEETTGPISLRKKIKYNPIFLESYEPNKTFYLQKEIRQEFLSLGFVKNVPLTAETYIRTILNRLIIDLSWNSSRLEGNTYSLLETKRLLELGEEAPGKNIIETQMILNHKEAIEYIAGHRNENMITTHDICSIHALLSANLLGDPSASGRLRLIPVGISGTSYVPLDNPYQIKEFLNIFIQKLNSIQDPFEQSFFALVHLSYLQAFEDVNKRTARIVSNIPLIKSNLKPLSFVDVNQNEYVKSLLVVYEKNDVSEFRELYKWAYIRSAEKYTAIQQTLAEPNPFKLKYRSSIQEIVRSIVINLVPGKQLVSTIKNLINDLKLRDEEATELFNIVEVEMASLHEGNIARFKIKPSEFQKWKEIQ